MKEKFGKNPISYVERPTEDWLARVVTCSLVNKDEQKLNTLCLPFMLEANRKIKAIIYADVNAFDIDYRAKSNERLTRILKDTGLLVLSFKRDYHPGKDSIIEDSDLNDGVKSCNGKITKIVSGSEKNLSIRYLTPAESYKVRTHKKEDVFRSVMISELHNNESDMRLVIYSPYPFEVHEETIKKGFVETGHHFHRRST